MLTLCFSVGLTLGQEFPIATGTDNTFALQASFDGTNYLLPIKGDVHSPNNATAQFISTSGSLVGNRVLVGANVGSINIASAFDGTNYFLAWTTTTGTVVGQFLSKSGSLVGPQLTIATNVTGEDRLIMLDYNAGSYMVCYVRQFLFGRIINPNGTLSGSEFQISSNPAFDASMAFDGTNYLIAYVYHISWSQPNDLYVKFLRPDGATAGSEMVVASGNFHRDNPLSLMYDGSKYLLAYHEQPIGTSGENFTLLARFIGKDGSLQPVFTIRDSSFRPFLPMIAFGRNTYLITYTQRVDGTFMGQWYTVEGHPIGSPFVILGSMPEQTPYGIPIFANNNFLTIISRVGNNFSNGDVYGKFLSLPLSHSLNTPRGYRTSLYPNPTQHFVTVSSNYTQGDNVKINIYQTTGVLVKSQWLSFNSDQINVADVENGVHLLEIQSNEWTERHKLMIQR